MNSKVSSMLAVLLDKESLSTDAESALQNSLLHILSAVQTIDHIPNAMYDFEVRLHHCSRSCDPH